MSKMKRDPVIDAWEEYLAKSVLEHEFEMRDLMKSESPDWMNGSIGVEVTKAYPMWYNCSEGNYERGSILMREGKDDEAGIYFQKSLVQHSDVCVKMENIPVGNTSVRVRQMIRFGDFYKIDVELLKKAIERKIGICERYKNCNELQLYVFMLGGFADWLDLDFMVTIRSIICKYGNKFSVVYVHQISSWKLYRVTQDTMSVRKLNSDFYNGYLDKLIDDIKRRQ